MGREIVYCEGCGISLREVDFEKGKAREIDHRNYCVACRPAEAAVPKPAATKGSTPRHPVPASTTPRRPTPTVPAKSNAGLIAGAVAGGIVLVLLIIVAASSGRPRETAVAKSPPSVAASTPERKPAETAPGRRPAAELREPEVLRGPTEQEKSARFDSFIAQIRSMIDQDKEFQRRAEIEGMIAAAGRSAGARAGDVEALRAHHAKAFDDGAKAACEAARRDAERLWAEKKSAEAIERAGEIPEAFRGTRPAEELRKWAEDQERRQAEAGAREREQAVARWREWKIDSTGSEESGYRPSHDGRVHAYQTHPHSREKPASLERTVDVPAGRKTRLSFWVAPDAQGDWQLRVLADGRELHQQIVGPQGSGWKPVAVDLSAFAGRKVALRLENAANDWSWEFGYWADLEIRSE